MTKTCRNQALVPTGLHQPTTDVTAMITIVATAILHDPHQWEGIGERLRMTPLTVMGGTCAQSYVTSREVQR
jgi:hypothetical protein